MVRDLQVDPVWCSNKLLFLCACSSFCTYHWLCCRPAIVVLLMSMVNEKQPFILRCAVLYCFQCFLFKNEAGQAQIAQTLLPSSSEHSQLKCDFICCSMQY